LESSIASGSIHPVLDKFLDRIRLLNLTEERGEETHAKMTRQHMHAPSGLRPWKGASARLLQQLAFYEDNLYPNEKEQFAANWPVHKRILQTRLGAKRLRPVQLSRRTVYNRLYEHDFSHISRSCELSPYQQSDGRAASSREDMIHIAHARGLLQTREYYTLGNDVKALKCFRVLWLIPPKKKWVRSGATKDRSDMDICIQYNSMWNLIGEGIPASLDVFPGLQNTTTVCALKLAPWDVIRQTLRVWKAVESDIDGCTSLIEPRMAEPPRESIDFLSKKISFLLLIEEVYRRGWRLPSEDRRCEPNTGPFATVFSKQKLSQRVQAYFQCLLMLPLLWDRGLQSFLHTLPAAYYQLLMRSPAPNEVPRGAAAQEYATLLEELGDVVLETEAKHDEGDSVVGSGNSGSDAEPDLVAAVRPRKRRRRRAGSTVGSAAGSSAPSASISGDAPGSPDSAVGSAAHAPGSDESSSGSAVGSVDEDALPPLVLPFIFEGATFSEKFAYDKKHVDVGCDHPHHVKCRKMRGLGPKQTGTYGDWESVCYLVAWRRLGIPLPDRPTHRDVPIPWESVVEAHDDIVAAVRGGAPVG
jgi:hypothetical protein